MRPTVSLAVEVVKAETYLAILCLFESGDELWIPKSQIHDDSEVYAKDHSGELVIPEWLAEEKGLI